MKRLTSPANPRIKTLARLQNASARRAAGRFLVESERELQRAIDAGFSVIELYLCDDLPVDETLVQRAGDAGAALIAITRPILDKVTYRQNPQGLVAVLERRTARLHHVALGDPPLVLVCTGLEKPGNIGAILRTADAAGVDAVFIDSPEADLFNPNCIRASTGAVFSMPIVCETGDELRDYLAEQGLTVIAATPDAHMAHTRAPFAEPCAIVLGSEDRGLDIAWREVADVPVCVPMFGRVDSLNVSVTAALLMYEARRQRASQPPPRRQP